MSLDDALDELALRAKKEKIKIQTRQEQQKFAPTAPNPDQPIVQL